MRANWLIAVLLVALLVSVTAVGTMLAANSKLEQNNSASSARLRMNDVLVKAQSAVQGEIGRLETLLAGAGARIGPLGLNGTQVRSDLNATIAADPCIMDIVTYDRNGVVIVAEPSSYAYLEGMDLSAAENIAQMLSSKMPVMSNVIPPIDDRPGAVMAVPVFDANGKFIGAVSALFSPSAMMNATLTPLSAGTDLTFWSIQLDGLEIYDTDPAQINMNLISGPDYQDYPQAQEMGRKVVNGSAGYVTYSYFVSMSVQKMVDKECYWMTVGAHGIEWRLVIAHRI